MAFVRLCAPALVFFAALAFAAPPAIEPAASVRIDEQLGRALPPDAVFTDSAGAPKKLGDYFNRGRPVILTLVYYECPMLCTLVLNGLTESLRKVDLEPGRRFDIVTISIDPSETPRLAADKRAAYLKQYGRPGADQGWFWHVGKEDQIRRLADALGFHYEYDPVTKQFAHQAAIFIITPEGRISRYLYGIDYPPRDVRLALLEAGREHIASTIDKIVLFCYHYDPAGRGYSLYAWRLVQIGAMVTLVVVAIVMAWFWSRERRRARKQTPPPGTASPG
ncbi:MAG: SCO family protein [Candidatus Sumerlaeia bacterium]